MVRDDSEQLRREELHGAEEPVGGTGEECAMGGRVGGGEVAEGVDGVGVAGGEGVCL